MRAPFYPGASGGAGETTTRQFLAGLPHRSIDPAKVHSRNVESQASPSTANRQHPGYTRRYFRRLLVLRSGSFSGMDLQLMNGPPAGLAPPRWRGHDIITPLAGGFSCKSQGLRLGDRLSGGGVYRLGWWFYSSVYSWNRFRKPCCKNSSDGRWQDCGYSGLFDDVLLSRLLLL